MKESFVVIEIGGVQHIVSVGDEIVVNHIEGEVGDKIDIQPVLLREDKGKTELGTPSLGLSVKAEIIKQFKAKKVDVRKYKAKARYRRKIGHRQFLTRLKIQSVSKASAKKPVSTKK